MSLDHRDHVLAVERRPGGLAPAVDPEYASALPAVKSALPPAEM